MKSCVFISNFFNRHQLPFSEAMNSRLNYIFIETEKIDDERLKLGYPNLSEKYPFILSAKAAENKAEVNKIINEADVVIAGGSNPLVYDRIKNGKLTFIYSERILKTGLLRFFSFKMQRYLFKSYYWLGRRNNLHLLAAGAYCPFDMMLSGIPKKRMWKWGYFPVMVPEDEAVQKNNAVPLILWAGRMIGWKHAEDILLAAALMKNRCRFHIRLIGAGDKISLLQQTIRDNGLENICDITPPMPQDEVLEEMKKADIYVQPSNQEEGWGAVINEALSAQCCVVAARDTGAAPWLIKNDETGFLYKSGDVRRLAAILEELVNKTDYRRDVAAKGRESVYRLWSGKVAAERLIRISEYLLGEGSNPNFSEGPCSRAKIMIPPMKLL
jgi:glycosyltransferase involved in cell wall biosynthesis